MNYILNHIWLLSTLVIVIAILVLVASQIIFIVVNGKDVPTPTIPRQTQMFGEGPLLKFVVIGDSTSIGQGASYERSIAVQSAQYFARTRTVELTNFGISGAVTSDVTSQQLQQAVIKKPDIVLLPVGANDVTHLTSLHTIESNMRTIISKLKAANPQVKIFITGSPDMSTVPRFAIPTQWVAGIRTKQVNSVMRTIADNDTVTFAPIADKTGEYFSQHPELFAADKFHPLAQGYNVWMPVLINAYKSQKL